MARGTKHPLPPAAPPHPGPSLSLLLVGPVQVEALRQKLATGFRLAVIIPLPSTSRRVGPTIRWSPGTSFSPLHFLPVSRRLPND